MSNTGLFVFASQENTSSNELYVLHDKVSTHTGISFGNRDPSGTVTRLSYQDGSGATLYSQESLTLNSDQIKLTLPSADAPSSLDGSYNFIVIGEDGTLQRGTTYVSDISDSVTQFYNQLKAHDRDISNLKVNVSTIISQIETNLTRIQHELNTLTTTIQAHDKKVQTQFNWVYGILIALFIILLTIIVILFITTKKSAKLIKTMTTQMDTMSTQIGTMTKDMAILKKVMAEILKS